MPFKSLSFSVRTRSQASGIIRLYQNTSYYLSIETKDGALRLRRDGGVIAVTSLPIADAAVHYIRINRDTILVDSSSHNVIVPALSISDVLIGGLPDVSGMTSFQGCIRDVRLNGEQLLLFNQSLAKFSPIQVNIALGCSSEDVCRKLSGMLEWSENSLHAGARDIKEETRASKPIILNECVREREDTRNSHWFAKINIQVVIFNIILQYAIFLGSRKSQN